MCDDLHLFELVLLEFKTLALKCCVIQRWHIYIHNRIFIKCGFFDILLFKCYPLEDIPWNFLILDLISVDKLNTHQICDPGYVIISMNLNFLIANELDRFLKSVSLASTE